MRPRSQGPCLVCGAPAVGINFGVATCAPCKAFFRRNAVKLGKIDFVCQGDGDCPVTCQSRRMCNCCRLAKCFRVGMQKSLILSAEEREARHALVVRNRQQRARQSLHQNLDLIRPSTMLRSMHNQANRLSDVDQRLLSNLFCAYEKTCQTSTSTSFEHLFHSMDQLSISTFFNQYSSMHISLIEYFKLIPEFHQLSISDKIRLMKNHFLLNLSINLPILYPTLPVQIFSSVSQYFSLEMTDGLNHVLQSFQVYLKDPILLKLLLIVISLSSSINRSSPSLDTAEQYDNTLNIYAAQNIYTDLLWRYVLSGQPSEYETVKFFNQLILFLLFLQRMTRIVDTQISKSTEQIEQMEPLMRQMWPQSTSNSEEELFQTSSSMD